MRLISMITTMSALFVGSILLTADSVLSQLESPSWDIKIEDLQSGNLFATLTGPTLWQQYPGVPENPSVLFGYCAIVFAIGIGSQSLPCRIV